ncbi:hypothetical protein [Azospirillum largimobile]
MALRRCDAGGVPEGKFLISNDCRVPRPCPIDDNRGFV